MLLAEASCIHFLSHRPTTSISPVQSQILSSPSEMTAVSTRRVRSQARLLRTKSSQRRSPRRRRRLTRQSTPSTRVILLLRVPRPSLTASSLLLRRFLKDISAGLHVSLGYFKSWLSSDKGYHSQVILRCARWRFAVHFLVLVPGWHDLVSSNPDWSGVVPRLLGTAVRDSRSL